MRPFLGLSLLTIFVTLAGCNIVPLENVESARLRAPENVTLERVKKGIIRAGIFRDWRMTEIEPGHILAQATVRNKHSATIDIFFDTKVFSIRYKDSKNLRYDGDLIHANYNQWVRNLKKDIQKEMQLIAIRGSLAPSPGFEFSNDSAG